jgi:hypothetical protein
MYNIKLTEDNYIAYCMKYYDNCQCNTIEEFEQDLYRIVCIKKIIDRYIASDKINIRLLLNHVIILHNSFDVIVPELLKLRLPEHHLPIVKPVLVFLKYIESDDWIEVISDSIVFNQLRMI